MLIVCLGWGSLVWDPRNLPTRGTWFKDGPFLPIEFARESEDGRLTLVIVESPLPDSGTQPDFVRSLWVPLAVSTVDEAQGALASREGCPPHRIGVWQKSAGISPPSLDRRIARWARRVGADAVVWTNLPPKFRGRDNDIPNMEQMMQHLWGLSYQAWQNAERYVRMAPRQIDTYYRRHMEKALGWRPLSSI